MQIITVELINRFLFIESSKATLNVSEYCDKCLPLAVISFVDQNTKMEREKLKADGMKEIENIAWKEVITSFVLRKTAG